MGGALGHLLLGQLLSVCLTVSGTLNQILVSQRRLDLAALQMTTVYTLVAGIFWLVLRMRSTVDCWQRQVQYRVPRILLISALDVTASLLCLHSYAFVMLPVVVLLSTLSTPSTMLFSRLLLRRAFVWRQIAGASLAVAGVLLLSVHDLILMAHTVENPLHQGLAHWGYLMGAVSALLYGISNVMTEQIVKDGEPLPKFLTINASFSTLWSLLYLTLFRHQEVSLLLHHGWSSSGALFLFYVISMVCFYSLIPILMQKASATLFNLSLLTVNFYSLLVGVLLFSQQISTVFVISFVFVVLGLLLFNWPIADRETGAQMKDEG